jgi:hypothetical protein
MRSGDCFVEVTAISNDFQYRLEIAGWRRDGLGALVLDGE